MRVWDYTKLKAFFDHVNFRVERAQRNTFMRHHGAKWAVDSRKS